MRKSLLYTLFGLGAIPDHLRPLLASEGVVVADEGMRGWFVTKNLKGPGRRYFHRRAGFSGCLAVTEKRVFCYAFRKKMIHIATTDPRLSAFFVDITGSGTFLVSFEASVFNDRWSGVMVFRFKTEYARQFYDAMRGLGAQSGSAADV